MKENQNHYDGAYFVKVAGKVIAGGFFEITPAPGGKAWKEDISRIEGEKLDKVTASFTEDVAADAVILTSPKHPGVELVLPPNSELTIPHVRELFRDIHEALAPKSFTVKPSPTRS